MDGLNYRARNLVAICIDSVENRHATGSLFFHTWLSPVRFFDLGEIIVHIDDFYDNLNLPQASMRLRSFNDTQTGIIQRIEVDDMSEAHDVINNNPEHRGHVATFIVQVHYRQNASWQGSVIWVEKNVTRNFRSVLELLKLIDGSLPDDSSDESN